LEQYIPAELPTYKECSLGKTDDQTSGQDHRQKSKKSLNNDVIVVQSPPPQCDQTPDTRCMSLDALGHQCVCKGGYTRSSPQHNCISMGRSFTYKSAASLKDAIFVTLKCLVES